MLSLTFRRRHDAAAGPAPTPDPFDRRGWRRSPVTYPGYRLGFEPPNKGLTLPPEVLSPDEIRELMAAPLTKGRTCALRNRALITVGARAGLRSAEALALYPKDVDLDRGRIHVMHGKGDRHRWVGFDPAACEVVAQWLTQRSKLGFDGRHRLFCVVDGPTAGRNLQAPYFRDEIKQLARIAGIDKRTHYHGLRHSYASWLLDHGAPIHVIMRMLGHRSLAITERYAVHLPPQKMIDALNEMKWPALDHAASLQSAHSVLTA